jgi:hypothetical protein
VRVNAAAPAHGRDRGKAMRTFRRALALHETSQGGWHQRCWPTSTCTASWAQQWRRREATGNVIVVRYADDIVAGFEHEADARRFWDAMRTRLGQFALELHEEKTRLPEFGR